MRPFKVLLGLVFLVSSVASADDAIGNAPQPPQMTVPDIANQLIIHQRFAEAEAFLLQQLTAPDLPPQVRDLLNYLLALALSGQQEYAAAVDILRELLDANPRMSQVRASLGRILFLQGHDAAAERQFDLVLADEKADERLLNIARQHLEAIRSRNGWGFSGTFSITENNNVNNAPDSSDSVVYIAGIPVSTNTRRERGVNFSWSGSANHRRRLSNAMQWETGFAVNGGAAAGALDQSTGAQVYTGPRFLFSKSALGVSGFTSYNWSYGHPTSNNYGLRAGYQMLLASDWRANFNVQYVRQNDIHNDDADADIYYGRAGVSFGITPATSGSAEINATRGKTPHPLYSYVSVGTALNLQHDFTYGFTLGGGISLSRLRRDGESPLFRLRQYFETTSISTFLIKRDWQIFGFAPKLSLTHTDTESNLSTSSHDNVITTIDFTRNF